MTKEIYNWTDNCCVSGVAPCNTDVLNDCLMYLKYNLIDADALNEQIATKTDKQQAAKASMPSNTVVELTLGATNSTHIAPANGYMSFSASTTAANGYVGLTRDDSNVIPEITNICYCPIAGKAVSVTIPVKMGDTVRSIYNNIGYTHLRFINAEGDQ